MNIRTSIVAGMAATSLCACSLAPGPYLDRDRLDDSAQPQHTAMKYTVRPIDIGYFTETRAALQPSVCPLTCLTKDARKRYQYRIGLGDQVTVIVWDHPELTGSPTGNMSGSTGLPPLPLSGNAGAAGSTGNGTQPSGGGGMAALSGGGGTSGGGTDGGLTLRVAGDGTLYFPRAGRIQAAGKTVPELQAELTRKLSKTIVKPQIDVRVSGFNSQSVQVTGNLRNPEAESLTDTPLTVLDAINRAGGAQIDADLQNVGVTRDGKRYTVDVAALLETGDVMQNVILQDGDIIDVPDRSNSRVFVLGEVAKPTSLPMNRGRLTLADAITGAGSIDIKTSDPRFIYVIRGADKTLNPDVYRLDMTQVDAMMLMTKFELQPKDVVYVQVASSARFNRALDQISPTLQTLFFTRELAR